MANRHVCQHDDNGGTRGRNGSDNNARRSRDDGGVRAWGWWWWWWLWDGFYKHQNEIINFRLLWPCYVCVSSRASECGTVPEIMRLEEKVSYVITL